jgi:hypothetical protein
MAAQHLGERIGLADIANALCEVRLRGEFAGLADDRRDRMTAAQRFGQQARAYISGGADQSEFHHSGLRTGGLGRDDIG